MKMILYDLRSSDEQAGFIRVCNHSLHKISGNPYLVEHGDVGGERWWTHFDEGRIPIKIRRGPVTFIGPTSDEFTGEPCDIIRYEADGRDHEYDREGFWLSPHIHVGDFVTVTTTKVTVKTLAGENTWIIVLKVEIEDTNNDMEEVRHSSDCKTNT